MQSTLFRVLPFYCSSPRPRRRVSNPSYPAAATSMIRGSLGGFIRRGANSRESPPGGQMGAGPPVGRHRRDNRRMRGRGTPPPRDGSLGATAENMGSDPPFSTANKDANSAPDRHLRLNRALCSARRDIRSQCCLGKAPDRVSGSTGEDRKWPRSSRSAPVVPRS